MKGIREFRKSSKKILENFKKLIRIDHVLLIYAHVQSAKSNGTQATLGIELGGLCNTLINLFTQ